MTRGNQRDQDRLKAQKKGANGPKKPKESATSLARRKDQDADQLRAKQQKALQKKAEEEAAANFAKIEEEKLRKLQQKAKTAEQAAAAASSAKTVTETPRKKAEEEGEHAVTSLAYQEAINAKAEAEQDTAPGLAKGKEINATKKKLKQKGSAAGDS